MATVIETKCVALSMDHGSNMTYIEKQGMSGWELKAYFVAVNQWQAIFQRRRMPHKRPGNSVASSVELSAT